jgi:hypothetical protein
LFEENLKLCTPKLDADHPHTLVFRNNLARAYDAVGQFAKSESLLRQSLTAREKTQPDDWMTFDIRSQLGGSLLGQKKYTEAEPLITTGYEGLKSREAMIPLPSKKRLTEAAGRVVQLYENWGKKDKAAEWRRKLAKPTDETK